jgi:cell division protein FtsL
MPAMNNLIENKVNPQKLQTIRQNVQNGSSKINKSLRLFLSIFTAVLLIAVSVYFVSNSQKALAVEFGLGNNYEEIIELNDSLATNVPLSINSISTSESKGDKRIVALLLFFEKYRSPMAHSSVAKAFVESADKNGFGDKWYLLPAISGIESSFGRIVPRTGNVLSYNGWGWSGGSKYGRWSYFSSWEDAAEKVSKGMAEGYGRTGLAPEKIMVSYCPPCAHPSNKGIWAKTVNKYIAEMKAIHASL